MFFVAAPFKKQRFCGVDEHISKGCGVMCSVGEQIMEKETGYNKIKFNQIIINISE